jgi:hypothetical protein
MREGSADHAQVAAEVQANFSMAVRAAFHPRFAPVAHFRHFRTSITHPTGPVSLLDKRRAPFKVATSFSGILSS